MGSTTTGTAITSLVTVLSDMSTIFTSITGLFGKVFQMFIGNPILLLTFGISFVSIVIAIARKFIGR